MYPVPIGINEHDCISMVIEKINWLHYLNYEDIDCNLSGKRHTVILSRNTYYVTSFHVLFLLFGHLFTLQLVEFCVRTYVRNKHTFAQL